MKSQYLFIFAGGLRGVILLFIILYIMGVSQTVCIGIGVVLALIVVYSTFTLNRKYGEHGLMKVFALKKHPRFIINRTSVRNIINHSFPTPTSHEKYNESSDLSR
ncbi:MAG: DUF4133 domain-containing protein, partial [Clostridium sp.]|nr:DUF4133 domain-containing protein [Clostridium sp.]